MTESRTRPIRLVIILGVLLWCAGILATPFLLSGGELQLGIGETLGSVYGRICHQMESRSLVFAENMVPVCARCMGVYCAFFLGSLFLCFPLEEARLHSPRRPLLMLALIPMLVDVTAGITGMYEPTMISRLATGSWFGFIAAVSILPVAVEAIEELAERRRTMKGVTTVG